MNVRRGPVVVLSLVLSAGILATAPAAVAGDGGSVADSIASLDAGAVKDTEKCSEHSRTRLRVVRREDGVLLANGIVWSAGTNRWDWRFKHNADLSASGVVKAKPGDEKAFSVRRRMVDLIGPDHFVFRAQNRATDEVCRVDVYY